MARRFQFEWTGLGGAPYLSTFYLPSDVAETPQQQVDALEAALTLLSPLWTPQLVVRSLPEVYVFSSPSVVSGVEQISPGVIVGGGGTTLASRATQGLLRLRTNTFSGNRRVLGKFFLPGVTTASMSGITGQPIGTYRTGLNSFGSDLVELGAVVASRKLNQFAPIVSADAWSEWAVQRGRRD